uniref:Uncharacterized protein n=1 Tax=Arundo donax TaxID=35708 RepID=A0A0A9HJA2_ARUDO
MDLLPPLNHFYLVESWNCIPLEWPKTNSMERSIFHTETGFWWYNNSAAYNFEILCCTFHLLLHACAVYFNLPFSGCG